MNDTEDWIFGTDLGIAVEEDCVCPYTGEYCKGLEISDSVCISCDIGMDNMIGQES